jgi:hypothetical protein
VAKQFQSIQELIEELQARDIRQVTVAGKVATTTSPGGERIAFRGRIIVGADLGRGERVEYVEQIMPYVTQTEAPDLPPAEEQTSQLRQAQQSLARQLRSYRSEYQDIIGAVRSRLTHELSEAGLSIVEPEH